MTVKTDNGPAYTSQSFTYFCMLWGVKHIIGIPYIPQGQAIIERAYFTLKRMIQNKKGEICVLYHNYRKHCLH